MKRLALALLTVAAAAHGEPQPTIRSTDFHANSAFVPMVSAQADGTPGAVEQLGEVVILEGDPAIVSDDGQGNYGIVFDQSHQQPPAITSRVYTKYADEFDEIIVFTTFDDTGASGALAYEMSAQQDVGGIGQSWFNDSGTWGATDQKLHAFVNMMRWDQFHDFDGLDVTDPQSGMYATLGQEFAHRWLSFIHYKDRTGKVSDAMLGRDKAHWASTLQADASVMDGDRLVDNGDGSFTNAEAFTRYSELDLYAMGLIDASAVHPWFLVDNAVELKGSPVDPTSYMRVGNRFRGTRENISIADVIAAEGPRVPSVAAADHAFRVAFVLVTRPGERASQVAAIARQLEIMRKVWEQSFAKLTGGRGTMCTQVSAPCGAPTAKLVGGRFVEAGGNHNGVVEPGEPVNVIFTLANDGLSDATRVSVKASADGFHLAGAASGVDRIAAGGSAEASFAGDLPASAACGVPLLVRGASTVDGHTFRGFAEVTPGIVDAVYDRFDDTQGLFAVNPDGKDTTTMNGWQWGSPTEYRGRRGWVFQPNGGHDSSRCWFTGLPAGHRAKNDSSVGVGSTSLWSPAIDVSSTYLPTLRYFVWYQAITFGSTGTGGTVNDSQELAVEASADGGKTWVKIDSVTGAGTSWQERTVALDGKKISLAHGLTFRFTASAPDEFTIVEAGIDDFQIITQTPACNPNASVAPTEPTAGTPPAGGCTVAAGRSSAAGLALFFAAALVLCRRRRR